MLGSFMYLGVYTSQLYLRKLDVRWYLHRRKCGKGVGAVGALPPRILKEREVGSLAHSLQPVSFSFPHGPLHSLSSHAHTLNLYS